MNTTNPSASELPYERALFEDWLKGVDPRKFTPEAYSDQHLKFKGWMARAAIARQAAPEAPTEPVAAQFKMPGETWELCSIDEEEAMRARGYKFRYLNASTGAAPEAPVQMILHCPKCQLQHVDAPDERTEGWTNPPHRSHLCHGCGHIWRPADVPTEGVKVLQTRGKNDSAAPEAPASEQQAIMPPLIYPYDKAITASAPPCPHCEKRALEPGHKDGSVQHYQCGECLNHSHAATTASASIDCPEFQEFIAALVNNEYENYLEFMASFIAFIDRRCAAAPTGAAPEAPASEQQAEADRVVEWSAAKATAASASVEALPEAHAAAAIAAHEHGEQSGYYHDLRSAEQAIRDAICAAVPSRDAAPLSDAELADPEYVRGYIEGCNDTVAEVLAENKRLRAALAAQAPHAGAALDAETQAARDVLAISHDSDELSKAAAAVVARWDSPTWKDQEHTAVFIDRLRAAVASQGVAQVAPDEQTKAARDVLAERRRQVKLKRWSAAHDDEHEGGELSLAAACYATAGDPPHGRAPSEWPWDESYWNPTDDRRNLIKAAALILADIERIDRAAMSAAKQGEQG